jgi:hypothetical protein
MEEPMTRLRPESHALLDAARGGDEPTHADRERVRAALATRLTVAAGAGAGIGVATAAKSSAAASIPSGLATKALVVAALLGVMGTIGAIGANRMRAGARTPAPQAPIATVPATPAPIDLPAPAMDLLHAATPLAPAVTPSEERAGTAHPSAPSVPVAAPTPASPTSDVAAEVRLIGEAQKAIRSGDAERALILLDEHAHRFPKGALGEERDAARIAALCALGRALEAREATARFLRAAPLSPHAGPLRASCGGSSATPAP